MLGAPGSNQAASANPATRGLVQPGLARGFPALGTSKTRVRTRPKVKRRYTADQSPGTRFRLLGADHSRNTAQKLLKNAT